MKSSLRLSALALSLALSGALPLLRADDASEALSSASKAYDAGNYTEAIQQLDFASTLIRQKKSESVAKLVPPAPAGWSAEETEIQGAGQALLGGMVGAKRSYSRDSGGSLTIEIQSDSPLMQSMLSLFANPLILSSSGAKLEQLKGQKIAVTYKSADKRGDIKAIVDNRYYVSIEGSELSRDDLLSFAKLIDFKALAALK